MGTTPVSVFPFVIGMAFPVPLDLLFSFWVFAWVWRFERMIGTAVGVPVSSWPMGSGWPHYAHQMIGIWMTVLGIFLWTGRHHLRGALRQALHLGSGTDNTDEPIGYRMALVCCFIGLAGMVAFLLALGITPTIAFPYALMLPGMFLVIARIRAELGPPMQGLMGAGPDRVIATFASPLVVGPRSWVPFHTMTGWLHRNATMTYPSGAHIDALKMGEIAGGMNRRFWWALVLVAVAGAALAFWLDAHLGFLVAPKRGATFPSYCGARCIWTQIGTMAEDATPRPNWGEIIAVGIGAGITLGLFFLRNLGINIPLHPVGYLLTGGCLDQLWPPILLAWLSKLLVLRYGGLALYRRVLPFFFGLILGQFLVGVGWQLVGALFRLRVYSFSW